MAIYLLPYNKNVRFDFDGRIKISETADTLIWPK